MISPSDWILIENIEILGKVLAWPVQVLTPQYVSKLENSAMATGLAKVSFHFNPKERQCQRMLKPPHNCAHFTS